MPRIAKDPQERRNEILDAAMELFSTKGYENTAVSDIVKKVGVAQGTFYYYFRSKDEIAAAAHERSLAGRLEFVRNVAGDSELSAVSKLRKVLLEGFPAPKSDQAILDYLHDESNTVLHQKWLVAKITSFTPFITEIVRQGVEEGVFQLEDPKEAAEFLLVGLSFWFDRSIFGWTEEELGRKLHALEGIIDRLLGGKGIISAAEYVNK
ncbi:TetR/AcrR family transcriptional regulator [Paenibacillus tuaregi]|uniref:TetR/AcrR family transcriptional regulator n=1 Tax=Paenibacillus tuaregi TaxID=1816681 RepID=UPI0008385C3D|nr:TetR/AcrR family transcriptional regulator [Paenibacillus tuaregi]